MIVTTGFGGRLVCIVLLHGIAQDTTNKSILIKLVWDKISITYLQSCI